jgi:hypothetical protein
MWEGLRENWRFLYLALPSLACHTSSFDLRPFDVNRLQMLLCL